MKNFDLQHADWTYACVRKGFVPSEKNSIKRDNLARVIHSLPNKTSKKVVYGYISKIKKDTHEYSESLAKQDLVNYYFDHILESLLLQINWLETEEAKVAPIKEINPLVLKRDQEHRFMFSKANRFKIYYNKQHISLLDKWENVVKSVSWVSPSWCGWDISESTWDIKHIPITLRVSDTYICLENLDTDEIIKMQVIAESSDTWDMCINSAEN